MLSFILSNWEYFVIGGLAGWLCYARQKCKQLEMDVRILRYQRMVQKKGTTRRLDDLVAETECEFAGETNLIGKTELKEAVGDFMKESKECIHKNIFNK